MGKIAEKLRPMLALRFDKSTQDLAIAIEKHILDSKPRDKEILPLSTDYRFGKSTQHALWSYNQALKEWQANLERK